MKTAIVVTVMEEKMVRDAVIRKATIRRKINWKKMLSYLVEILSIVIGITLIICNETKTVPAEWGTSWFTDFLYFFISYGLLIGGMFILMGVCLFIEMKDEKQKPRKKRRRTRY